MRKRVIWLNSLTAFPFHPISIHLQREAKMKSFLIALLLGIGLVSASSLSYADVELGGDDLTFVAKDDYSGAPLDIGQIFAWYRWTDGEFLISHAIHRSAYSSETPQIKDLILLTSLGTVGIGDVDQFYFYRPQTELQLYDTWGDDDSDVRLRMQSDGSNNDAVIEFYENTAASMSIHYDGGNGANELTIRDIRNPADIKLVTFQRDGSVGIGTDAPQYLLDVDGTTAVQDLIVSGDIAVQLGGAGSTPVCVDNNDKLSLCSSSRRHKEKIKPLDIGLDTVNRLEPVTFDWRQGGKRDLGLIAEDVATVDPLLVNFSNDGQIQGVKYPQLTAVLIRAIKELKSENKDLRAELEKNKARIEKLSAVLGGN